MKRKCNEIKKNKEECRGKGNESTKWGEGGCFIKNVKMKRNRNKQKKIEKNEATSREINKENGGKQNVKN